MNKFRSRHLQALAGLFGQVLQLCQRAGMVKLGHVALDGTKIQANASKQKAMSYERMKKTEKELEATVRNWLRKGRRNRRRGRFRELGDKRGDEPPDWVADKAKRLEKLRAAKAELEAEAKLGRSFAPRTTSRSSRDGWRRPAPRARPRPATSNRRPRPPTPTAIRALTR